MIGSEPLPKIVCPAQVDAKPDVVRRFSILNSHVNTYKKTIPQKVKRQLLHVSEQ